MAVSVFAAIPTVQAPPPAYPKPDEMWKNTDGSGNVTDVAIGDLIGNGTDDVAFIDDEIPPDTVFAVYGNNGSVHRRNLFVCDYSIAVGDVDDDGKNEVVAGAIKIT